MGSDTLSTGHASWGASKQSNTAVHAPYAGIDRLNTLEATSHPPLPPALGPRTGRTDHTRSVWNLVRVTHIPLQSIVPNPAQPRTQTLTGIAALAASIRQYGLLQPIVVEPLREEREEQFRLLAGARRYAAFQLLSRESPGAMWARIPAVVRPSASGDPLVLALLENVARHQLEEGELMTALRVLRDLKGWGPTEMARHLGVTRQWIQQYFRVAKDPELSQYVQGGRFSIAKAHEVQLAQTAEARTEALEAALQGAPLRHIRALARSKQGAPKTAKAPSDLAPRQAGDQVEVRQQISSDGERKKSIDAVDAAASLGMRVHLREFQLSKLILAAAEKGTDEVDMAALVRTLRADLHRAEAKIRLALTKV
ncbi:MAG TPA: ParB/RepB/Spo0J family partition protein [Chloroflexota bacterium]|nr:ParB/RepB/Spo0J family partition protein [Chloroflexota bacterium]